MAPSRANPVGWVLPTLLLGLVAGVCLPAAGGERLVALGDLGSVDQARPDGNADRIIFDSDRQSLLVHFLGPDGLDHADRSDLVQAIDILSAGLGYGRQPASLAGLRVRSIARSSLSTEALELIPGLGGLQDMPQDGGEDDAAEIDLWTIPLEVDHTGTEGHGLMASAVLDGRGGAWSYYPVEHPWKDPCLRADDLPIGQQDNDLTILTGGSGCTLPAATMHWQQSRLRLRLLGDAIGSVGFVPGLKLDDDSAVTRTQPFFDITGDIVGPLLNMPGNWRNLLGHTPASCDAAGGWRVSFAATRPGQLANVRLVADGWSDPIWSLDAGGEIVAGGDSLAEEARQFLTEHPPEPTTGRGYDSGVFEIRDGHGLLVRGWTIRYETDAKGRIYVNAKGSAKRIAGNMTSTRVGVENGDVYMHGWTIEHNPAAIIDPSGWTLHPGGSGTGFRCEGIECFGQLIALPPISNVTETLDGFNATQAPEIQLGRGPGLHLATVGRIEPTFAVRQPARGQIIGIIIDDTGHEYYRTPTVQLPEWASGSDASLVASLGDDGRRNIDLGGPSALLSPGDCRVHANGDFNADGITDLLVHNEDTGETELWLLGEGTELIGGSPQALPLMSPAWTIGGIGRFGWDGAGCCVLWRNRFNGVNAIWIIDATRPNPADWIRPESAFLPTVTDPGWQMACTNNAVRNVGDRLYWVDPVEGSVASWKIDVDPSRPPSEWVGAPDYVRDPDGERILGMASTWELIGAGSLGGQPQSEGADAFRDLLFFDRATGRSAIWLLDHSGSRIDGEAPNSGAGFLTRAGAVIGGEVRFCKPVGIGQYALEGVRWSHLGEGRRAQWFPTIGWSMPAEGPWFTWQLDRRVNAVRKAKGRLKGTGKSASPFQVIQLR